MINCVRQDAQTGVFVPYICDMNSAPDSDPKLQALISLLDEPDHGSFLKVRDQIFSYGTTAVPMLESAWENTFDNSVQQRIEDIIHNIQYDQLFLDLTRWAHFNKGDLLEACILFTRFQYQNILPESMHQQVQQIGRDIWLELNDNLTALEKVKVLNHIVFDLHQYRLPAEQTSDPRFLFLSNVLESKTGYSFTIGLLYTILAQSMRMPVYPVLLPGERYVMAWLDEHTTPVGELPRVMFYINPENKGSVFTRNEIVSLLKRMSIKSGEHYFRPADNCVVIDKLFSLLAYLYREKGEATKAARADHLRSSLL